MDLFFEAFNNTLFNISVLLCLIATVNSIFITFNLNIIIEFEDFLRLNFLFAVLFVPFNYVMGVYFKIGIIKAFIFYILFISISAISFNLFLVIRDKKRLRLNILEQEKFEKEMKREIYICIKLLVVLMIISLIFLIYCIYN
ncbi:hypothetical protein [Streptobacillus moniliformis]|uniref:hypothetical protein n=1 Tax=Streptobacillus moniliformis TaxID=34105 RepID=UPI0007E3CB72|nr:hypothetical protein [Streptobacillus moniliformis]